ncbi:MAG: hypothetical protein HOV94_31445 [Saccharothrix sp.]|nr:hypothetical protein [Saccharothrix sp.]
MANFAAPVHPAPIRTAITLLYAGLAATALAVILVIVEQGQLDANFRASYASYGDQRLTEVVSITLTYLFTLAVLSALVYLALIWATRKGKRWARIVATVGFVLATVLGFYHFHETYFPLLLTLGGILPGLVGLVAAVLMWTRGASAHFSRKSAG